MTFLDSNVFVYAVDTRDAEKQKIAKSIVMSARDSAEYVISAQVLNEFSNVAMRKPKNMVATGSFLKIWVMDRYTVASRLSIHL